MNTLDRCPFPTRWTAGQIAGAVRVPLHALDLSLACDNAGRAASGRKRVARGGYLFQGALAPRFRIHG